MEILAKSKGGNVSDRLKEAGGNAASRRTEMSYKAERSGETAQHVEAPDSGRTVNDAVVQLQFTFLSGETCPTEQVQPQAALAEHSSKCIDTPATVAGSASYSAVSSMTRESADDGNIAGDETGVSREHTTDALSNEANASAEDNSGRLEQEGRRGHKFARYADDFVILVKSRRAGERVLRSVQRFLAKRLRLELNEAKSGVVRTEGCEFLGFTFRGEQIRWSHKAEREFKRRVRRLTARRWGVSMAVRLAKLSQYIRGWMGYFGLSEYYTILPTLDEWLRRRVRSCYWKMWRRPRNRIRQLIKLGTGKRSAILAGLSRKGYWRLARTLSTHTGMTNAWLAEQGVLSLKELWVNIHYPEGKASKHRLPR